MTEYKREAINKDLRHFIYYRDSGICAHCGATVNKNHMHIDHVIPFCKDGEYDE